MPPNEQFQTPQAPAPRPSRWSRLVIHLSRPYIWIPASIVLAAMILGGCVWLVNAYESTAQSDQSTTSASSDLSDKPVDKPKADKTDEKNNQKNTKKSKEAKKTDTPKPKTGSATDKPIQSSPPPSSGSLVKPDASNTGPRMSATRTLSPSQALSELRRTGRLSGVTINGSLQLSGSDGRNWIIEDSVILTTGNYGIQSYISLDSFTGTKAERPVFRYVEIRGSAAIDGSSCSAVVYGRDIVLQNADIYGCDDGVKASHRVSIISSWLHDNDHPSGAHCDSLQIRSGTDILVRGSRFDAYVGYSSDGSQTPSGSTCSGGLQTGSVTNTISARFENNWFAGGHYTIRGWASRDSEHTISYVFRNNKWMRYGTSVRLGLTNLPANRYGATTGSLGAFDSSNVWEDTGQPVRN